ncbi:hypothetical protein BsWGS_05090 [Bradybaena similaris]
MLGYYRILPVVVALLNIMPSALTKRGCSFKHSGCTYNIRLNHHKHKVGSETEHSDCANKEQQVYVDSVQNDYTSKIDDMEKNFSFLRDAHEQRLKELERSVKDLLDLDKPGTNADDITVDISQSKPPSLFNNDVLLGRIEEEFGKLRQELKRKSTQLIDTRIKLNETTAMVHEARLEHFKTSKELLNAENEITMLRRERAVLKNQLKDRNYKLDVSSQKATECETKSTDQQDKMVELFRSENNLKEELLTVQLQLNLSKSELLGLEEKYDSLKSRHDQMRVVMKIRERELMSCYSARISTFCGFEDPNLCGFTNINDTSDFFDWERGRGLTPSPGTGPSKDHTCDGPKGHFMYIEASAKGRGSNAILYSPLYRGMSEQCIEFFYHMNGRHIGTLNVYAQPRGDTLKSAWRAYGNQGDYWTSARLAIPQELARAGYQIAFEGITENGYLGDMAIDDVSVTDGPCPIDERVVPVRVSINSTKILDPAKAISRKLRIKGKSSAPARRTRDNRD